jgi:hypothetical protein
MIADNSNLGLSHSSLAKCRGELSYVTKFLQAIDNVDDFHYLLIADYAPCQAAELRFQFFLCHRGGTDCLR